MAGVRARARPRQRSVNFRRLWWVLTREAALRVLNPDPLPATWEPGSSTLGTALRWQLCWRDTSRVRTVAGIVLALYPQRRQWPPEGP